MPDKRAPNTPAKKAPRPANTTKKQAPQKTAATKPKSGPIDPKITVQLQKLLSDPSASARSIVDFIVSPNCGLEKRHKFGNNTSFLLAVDANRVDVVQLLVAEHAVNTKAVREGKYTAVHVATFRGYSEMIKCLVEQCGLDINAIDKYGQSPLHKATAYSKSDIALLLLELGADPNISSGHFPPLHYACTNNLVDVVRLLLKKGASTCALDANGKTPLELAVQHGHSELVALLEGRV